VVQLKSLPRDSEGDSIAEDEDEDEEEDDEDDSEDGSDEDADPSPTPHHVPEINESTTRIPGLKAIYLVTSNGRFWILATRGGENV